MLAITTKASATMPATNTAAASIHMWSRFRLCRHAYFHVKTQHVAAFGFAVNHAVPKALDAIAPRQRFPAPSAVEYLAGGFSVVAHRYSAKVSYTSALNSARAALKAALLAALLAALAALEVALQAALLAALQAALPVALQAALQAALLAALSAALLAALSAALSAALLAALLAFAAPVIR